jgi:arginase
MPQILVPYHLDEYLPDLDLPVTAPTTLTVELPEADVWSRLACLYQAVADTVTKAIVGAQRPAVLSGDCMTALGTMAGLQRAGLDPAIVWLDAHGDVQTLETTASGYLGGMPLRLLVGYRPELLAEPLGLRAVGEERVVLVDARDLDPPEAQYLQRAAIRRREVAELVAGALPDGPLYLHLDVDVVDPGELGGLRFPAPGGPGWSPVAEALGVVLGTGRVAAFGVACSWHPGRGAGDQSRRALEPLLTTWA